MQTVFRRYELKYLLTQAQKASLLEAAKLHIKLDRYEHASIRNLYFDTDDYRLIRRSVEKPVYKEKLRIRCYGSGGADLPVFVELKKKYDSVVYKRRVVLPQDTALDWLCAGKSPPDAGQICQEIAYFMSFYGSLSPKLFLAYDREAYTADGREDLRITFDTNIRCRDVELDFDSDAACQPILPDDAVLMEIKCCGAIPLWLTEILSRKKLYKTSFSKYGTAYQNIIYPKYKEEKQYAR